MIEVDLERCPPGLPALFDREWPNHTRILSVLERRTPGVVLADRLVDPNWCVVREAGGGQTFFGGTLDAPQLHEALSTLLELGREREALESPSAAGHVHIQTWLDDDDRDEMLPKPDTVGAALMFDERPPDDERAPALARRVPARCEVRPMDRELFERCLWRDHVAAMMGGADGFLKHGLGFCLMRGEEILSEGYADYSGGGSIEIGVITHEPHQERGYASIVCAHVIEACEARGLQTYWSCDKTNLAAVAVARKLGYPRERESRFLCFEPTDEAA